MVPMKVTRAFKSDWYWHLLFVSLWDTSAIIFCFFSAHSSEVGRMDIVIASVFQIRETETQREGTWCRYTYPQGPRHLIDQRGFADKSACSSSCSLSCPWPNELTASPSPQVPVNFRSEMVLQKHSLTLQADFLSSSITSYTFLSEVFSPCLFSCLLHALSSILWSIGPESLVSLP